MNVETVEFNSEIPSQIDSIMISMYAGNINTEVCLLINMQIHNEINVKINSWL
jgi:hypothetical protein